MTSIYSDRVAMSDLGFADSKFFLNVVSDVSVGTYTIYRYRDSAITSYCDIILM